MFETPQQKRYRTFDGQPVHTSFAEGLLKDPVVQGGLLVTAFTAAVSAQGGLFHAAVTFGSGIAGTVLPVLLSRWLLARDMRDQFNGQATNVIDTQPQHDTAVTYEAITNVSREFHDTAMKRLRIGAVFGFFAAEPVTRVMTTVASLADKMQGQDMFMACFALGFMISQWGLMDLHKKVENNQARIVRIPAPDKN
jgi:hypothetical protein